MEIQSLFIDEHGRLRSGWRVALFLVGFFLCYQVFEVAGWIFSSLTRPIRSGVWVTAWPYLIGSTAMISSAILVAWACGVIFERLSFRSTGWSLHRGWLRDVGFGSLIGAASLLLAAGIAAAAGGIRFSFNPSPATAIAKTVLVTLVVFVIAGAAEEALFRGYPLQTLTRARLAWLGVLVTSIGFGIGHLGNPNVSKGLPFINTVLAGVWFAIAYLRTRSMWLPVGLHWSWNWIQAAVLGIPVSGNERFAPDPFLHAMNAGPNWLTGGAYGLEGGVACTIALLISTVVIWRTKLLAPGVADATSPHEVASEATAQ